jgi:TonB family protein
MRPLQLSLALATGALLGLASSARSQAAPLPLRPMPCSLDSSAAQLVTVFLALVPPASHSSRAQAQLSVAMAMASHFRQPSQLHINSWPGTYFPQIHQTSDPTLGTEFGLGGMFRFDLDHASRLASRPPVITTDSPDLNAALAEALQAAANDGSFVPATGTQRFDIIESSAPTQSAVTFARFRLRAIPVDRVPRFLWAAPPIYPRVAARRGLEDRVVLEFIIQEDGSVDPSSPRVLRATYEEFVESALATIRKARYEPGTVHGCPVRTRVAQAVNFRVR